MAGNYYEVPHSIAAAKESKPLVIIEDTNDEEFEQLLKKPAIISDVWEDYLDLSSNDVVQFKNRNLTLSNNYLVDNNGAIPVIIDRNDIKKIDANRVENGKLL